MKPATGIAAVLLNVVAGVASGQQYGVSTIVGGVFPLGPMPPLEVSVGHVSGVAADRAGNIYFSSALGCVFRLDAGGMLVRVAETCQAGYSADGGPATAAKLTFPRGLAVDSNGTLFIADYAGCRVRRVTKDGTIATIAGNGTCRPASADGASLTNPTLSYPTAVAVDALGAVFVAESDRVRKFSPGGAIATIATGLSFPAAVAFDSAGGVYIAAGAQVLEVASDGAMTTVAGIPDGTGDTGDGGLALSASFGIIIGLAVDSAGDVIVADGTIRSISPDGIVRTIADNACCSAVNVPQAWSGGTGAVAVDTSGNIYVAVLTGDVLRKVTPPGGVTTVAGTDDPSYVGDGGPAIQATLSSPQAVAVDTSGNLYIADYGDSRVRKVSPTGAVTTIAGTGISGLSGDGGPATTAQLGGPDGLAIDSAGNLFISEYLNNRVRKVTPDGAISTVAGSDLCCDPGDDGPATRAVVPMPHGIALDSAGNLYITEWPDSRIRKVTAAGIISTVAGNGTRGFSGDGGPAIEAQLNLPWGVTVDGNGNIYFADNQNLRIRKVSPDGIITTVAGGPASGFLNAAPGITVDSAGNLFTSGGWMVSPYGAVSATTAHSADGSQVYVSGVGITVDSGGELFLASGNQILKLEPIGARRHRVR